MELFTLFSVYLITFLAVSFVDYLWHLVLLRAPFEGVMREVGVVEDGKIQLQSAGAGLISQVLVVGVIMFLVLYGTTEPRIIDGALIGAAGGVLAISVYGLVNRALVKGWNRTVTILEVLWGPMLGAFAGSLVAYLVQIF